MKNIKFNDWQEMALKKDMETIIKKLNTQEPLFFSLCWEIVLAVGTIIVDHLFDTTDISVYWWIVVVVLAIVPPIIILICKIYKWIYAVGRVKAGVYDVKKMVDAFDNQICYWVMMCNSYCNLLSNDSRDNEKKFLYQEGCYYNNKSMQALYHMNPVIDKVFSDNSELVTKDNIVAVYRLLSLLEMMNQYQLDLDHNISDVKDDPIIKEQAAINKIYQEHICQFIKGINELFNKEFEWKKDTSDC